MPPTTVIAYRNSRNYHDDNFSISTASIQRCQPTSFCDDIANTFYINCLQPLSDLLPAAIEDRERKLAEEAFERSRGAVIDGSDVNVIDVWEKHLRRKRLERTMRERAARCRGERQTEKCGRLDSSGTKLDDQNCASHDSDSFVITIKKKPKSKRGGAPKALATSLKQSVAIKKVILHTAQQHIKNKPIIAMKKVWGSPKKPSATKRAFYMKPKLFRRRKSGSNRSVSDDVTLSSSNPPSESSLANRDLVVTEVSAREFSPSPCEEIKEQTQVNDDNPSSPGNDSTSKHSHAAPVSCISITQQQPTSPDDDSTLQDSIVSISPNTLDRKQEHESKPIVATVRRTTETPVQNCSRRSVDMSPRRTVYSEDEVDKYVASLIMPGTGIFSSPVEHVPEMTKLEYVHGIDDEIEKNVQQCVDPNIANTENALETVTSKKNASGRICADESLNRAACNEHEADSDVAKFIPIRVTTPMTPVSESTKFQCENDVSNSKVQKADLSVAESTGSLDMKALMHSISEKYSFTRKAMQEYDEGCTDEDDRDSILTDEKQAVPAICSNAALSRSKDIRRPSNLVDRAEPAVIGETCSKKLPHADAPLPTVISISKKNKKTVTNSPTSHRSFGGSLGGVNNHCLNLTADSFSTTDHDTDGDVITQAVAIPPSNRHVQKSNKLDRLRMTRSARLNNTSNHECDYYPTILKDSNLDRPRKQGPKVTWADDLPSFSRDARERSKTGEYENRFQNEDLPNRRRRNDIGICRYDTTTSSKLLRLRLMRNAGPIAKNECFTVSSHSKNDQLHFELANSKTQRGQSSWGASTSLVSRSEENGDLTFLSSSKNNCVDMVPGCSISYVEEENESDANKYYGDNCAFNSQDSSPFIRRQMSRRARYLHEKRLQHNTCSSLNQSSLNGNISTYSSLSPVRTLNSQVNMMMAEARKNPIEESPPRVSLINQAKRVRRLEVKKVANRT